ncbi:MAG TPA: cytochrome c biogenesis protein ResB [Geobacteraceae bacterium]
MFKKLTKYLSSIRFTIALICLLGLIFLLGLWIPQKSLVQNLYFEWKQNAPGLVSVLDALQLTSIHSSPITLLLWFLFFVNLALVLWQRVPLIRKRIELSESRIADPQTAPGYFFKAAYELPPEVDGPTLLQQLSGKGYALVGGPEGFYGVKNRYSPIAFALFHLSFFLILLGGVIGVYTRFVGYVDLAQGEEFQGELERYNRMPLPSMPKIGSIPKAAFTVESITPQVVNDTPTGIDVRIVDGQGKSHDAGINTPYVTDNTSFVFKHLGMAPLFVLKDPAGREVDGAYEKLDVAMGKKDRFVLGGFEFTARFFPDYAVENGKPITRSQEFKNQVFTISVAKDGQLVAEGVIPKNGTMQFNGYTLEMRELPFWVRFYVIRQRGLWLIYIGSAIASLAVIWRLIFYRRELTGKVQETENGSKLLVAARSEYYKSLAEDEFDKLFQGLRLKENQAED